MITQDKLSLYIKYNGDIDHWARNSIAKEQLIMSDADWYMIDSLLQDLYLVKQGMASAEFEKNVNNKLKENCDPQIIDKLVSLAKKK
jgi:hypothetical protein